MDQTNNNNYYKATASGEVQRREQGNLIIEGVPECVPEELIARLEQYQVHMWQCTAFCCCLL